MRPRIKDERRKVTRCLLAQVCTLSTQKSDHAVTLSGNNVLCLLTLEVFVTVWYIYLVLAASLSTHDAMFGAKMVYYLYFSITPKPGFSSVRLRLAAGYHSVVEWSSLSGHQSQYKASNLWLTLGHEFRSSSALLAQILSGTIASRRQEVKEGWRSRGSMLYRLAWWGHGCYPQRLACAEFGLFFQRLLYMGIA